MRADTYTPEQARAERDRLEALMLNKYGTTSRSELHQITLSGELTWDEISEVERYDTFCYFTED